MSNCALLSTIHSRCLMHLLAKSAPAPGLKQQRALASVTSCCLGSCTLRSQSAAAMSDCSKHQVFAPSKGSTLHATLSAHDVVIHLHKTWCKYADLRFRGSAGSYRPSFGRPCSFSTAKSICSSLPCCSKAYHVSSGTRWKAYASSHKPDSVTCTPHQPFSCSFHWQSCPLNRAQ